MTKPQPPHADNDEFEKAVIRCIPSEFTLIAGQADTDEAQEAYAATKLFHLPNPIGKEGGVATSSLLTLLYDNVDRVVCNDDDDSKKKKKKKPLSVRKVLKEMHRMAKDANVDSIPQMSSSRPLAPPRLEHHRSFYIVPPGRFTKGKRRALCIGVNFSDSDKPLRAPHNDCHNVQHFLRHEAGFEPGDTIVLRDDGKHEPPTKQNILDGFQKMVDLSEAGDVVFISYSGHGGLVKDKSGDEEDGYDSVIFPVDYQTAGAIIDDDILKDLIKAMPEGVHTTMLVDCCYSGTVGDLPYVVTAGHRKHQDIEHYFDTDTREEILEKERRAGEAAKEKKRAKAERKRQRELRRKRVEAETREYERAVAAGEILPMGATMPPPPALPAGTTPAIMMAAGGAPTTTQTQTFTVGSQAELDALCTKFGTVITLSKEQKDIMEQGGTVTTTFTTTTAPAAMMSGGGAAPAMMMQQQQQGGQPMMMMSPEQAAAFAKQHGGQVFIQQSGPIMMTPEQAALFAKQQQK